CGALCGRVCPSLCAPRRLVGEATEQKDGVSLHKPLSTRLWQGHSLTEVRTDTGAGDEEVVRHRGSDGRLGGWTGHGARRTGHEVVALRSGPLATDSRRVRRGGRHRVP